MGLARWCYGRKPFAQAPHQQPLAISGIGFWGGRLNAGR